MADTESMFDSANTLQRPSSTSDALAAVPQGEARYEQIGLLGEGGMGRVIEAVDKQFSRVVAIKELRGNGDAARLETEALVTGNLEHPGVPPVYERGLRPDGNPYYVMRRVRGRSLEEELNDAKDATARRDLVRKLTRAAETLGFAHEKGVVHRDVKPQNIMLGTHGEVFVVDWGLARAGSLGSKSGSASETQTGQSPALTMMGQVMGTPAYMAPEQARGDIAMIDARTDVFALGAVLYRILSGRPPYDGSTTAQAIDRARLGDHPSIDVVAADAPVQLRDICKRAMAAQPEQRYATAQHMADALDVFTSTAVARAYEKTAKLSTAVAIAFGFGATSFGLAGLARFAPGELFGTHMFFSGSFFILAVWLAWLEWRGKGRLGLAPLGYGAAATTMITGFIATGITIAQRTGEPGFEWIRVAREAAVGLTLAGLLSALALGVWGLVMYQRPR